MQLLNELVNEYSILFGTRKQREYEANNRISQDPLDNDIDDDDNIISHFYKQYAFIYYAELMVNGDLSKIDIVLDYNIYHFLNLIVYQKTKNEMLEEMKNGK